MWLRAGFPPVPAARLTVTSGEGGPHAFAIELAGVTKTFDGLAALARIHLARPHRSRTWIVGPSGGGKTTLLQIIVGLLEADTGLVRVVCN
jgi:ABC-type Fe3+/spermidine/putrescine transport system ATPase subunit